MIQSQAVKCLYHETNILHLSLASSIQSKFQSCAMQDYGAELQGISKDFY